MEAFASEPFELPAPGPAPPDPTKGLQDVCGGVRSHWMCAPLRTGGRGVCVDGRLRTGPPGRVHLARPPPRCPCRLTALGRPAGVHQRCAPDRVSLAQGGAEEADECAGLSPSCVAQGCGWAAAQGRIRRACAVASACAPCGRFLSAVFALGRADVSTRMHDGRTRAPGPPAGELCPCPPRHRHRRCASHSRPSACRCLGGCRINDIQNPPRRPSHACPVRFGGRRAQATSVGLPPPIPAQLTMRASEVHRSHVHPGASCPLRQPPHFCVAPGAAARRSRARGSSRAGMGPLRRAHRPPSTIAVALDYARPAPPTPDARPIRAAAAVLLLRARMRQLARRTGAGASGGRVGSATVRLPR